MKGDINCKHVNKHFLEMENDYPVSFCDDCESKLYPIIPMFTFIGTDY
mgnify:CR=1 FL=1